MEDDVEVELELEKQLSLAHELFWWSIIYHMNKSPNKYQSYYSTKNIKTQYPNMLVKKNRVLKKEKKVGCDQ